MIGQRQTLIARMLPKVLGIAALLTGVWWLVSGSVSPLFAVTWAIVLAIVSFRTRIGAWPVAETTIELPVQVQIALALTLLLVTAITTHWTDPGERDLVHWVLAVFPVWSLYQRAFAWAWSQLTGKE